MGSLLEGLTLDALGRIVLSDDKLAHIENSIEPVPSAGGSNAKCTNGPCSGTTNGTCSNAPDCSGSHNNFCVDSPIE